MAGTLWTVLEAIEDRRTIKGRCFPLPAIILIALAAMFSGTASPGRHPQRGPHPHSPLRLEATTGP